MGLEVFMAVTIKNAAVLYMTPCSLLKIYQHFSFLQTVGRLLPECVMTDLTGYYSL